MPAPNFVLLYVAQPEASAAFYARLLGQSPADSSPNFAMFALPGGLMLGLWARHDVKPPAAGGPGSAELAMTVADRTAVNDLHAAWRDQGIDIAQPPTAMDFGYTFTALDPDGHRLRVFAPTAA
jgi:predicted enzyme related to lactoylglutathione lyase